MKNNERVNCKKSSGLPIIDLLLGIIDKLFKDGATGKVLAGRVAALFAIFLMLLVWFKLDTIATAYKDASFENYATILSNKKEQQFGVTVQEQIQIVHASSDADLTAAYVFRPKNYNYFVDLEVYEGRIPTTVDTKNMGGYPIDKTTVEYQTHLNGIHFETTKDFNYLPTTDIDKGVNYMYSCPYFNMANVYSGSIAMYWYDTQPHINKERLGTICNQAARVIGRTR